MKSLKLLNKKNFSIILALSFSLASFAEEQPVDIWNLEKEKDKVDNTLSINENNINENNQSEFGVESDIYKMQSKKKKNLIELDQNLNEKDIKKL